MNKYAIALGLLAAVGCKKGDDCTQVFDKLASVEKEIAGMKDKFLEQCHKDHDKFAADPVMKCVLEASDNAAIDKCTKKRGHENEAAMQLNKLGKILKMKFAENAAFPIGKAKTLPAPRTGDFCCGDASGKCAASTEWATDPVWKALEFSIDEPTMYRYSYESTDGKTFTATAVGDADCDGSGATFTLNGTTENGNVSANLVMPPKGSY